MSEARATVQPWTSPEEPQEEVLRQKLAEEGMQLYRWSNGPGDTYELHTHDFHKVIYVLDGSVTFHLPDTGEKLDLSIGDRMDLPAGIRHETFVGDDGVVCLEGHR